MKKMLKTMTLMGAIFLLPSCSTPIVSDGKSSSVTTSSFDSTYKLYETITIPSHTFEEEGVSVSTKGTIVTPSGKAYSSSTYTLTETGKYSVKYNALINNHEYTYEESFKVLKPLFEYSNTENTTVSNKIPSFAANYTSAQGIYVTLAKGDTLKINQPIDVSSTTQLDKIITGFATPLEQGTFDFSNINFVLTDSENPDIYLTVLANGQPNAQNYAEYSYWRAGGQNQITTGKYTKSDGSIQYQTSGILGTLCLLPFHAALNAGSLTPTPIDPSEYPFYFAYDSEDVAVYTDCTLKSRIPSSAKCADLDNLNYFSRVWSGFPSGKAYLSIYAGKFQSNASRFCITSILGVDLTKDTIEDNEGPVISVDEKFSDNLPEGVLNSSYHLPVATAYDEYEKTSYDVDTRVYYNYGTSSQINIEVDNNSFVPKQNGNYAVVYEASDSFGNITTKVMGIHVGNNISPINFDLPTNATSIKGGESITLNDATNISGGVGLYQQEIEVVNPSGEKEVIDDNDYEPKLVGNYQVNYTIEDYVGNQLTKSSTFEVTDNDELVLVSVSDLNDSYLTTYSNKLPTVIANATENGKVNKVTCDVIVADAAGSITYKLDEETTFILTSSDTIKTATFNFVYNGKLVKTSTVSMVDATDSAGKLCLANYFIGENIDAHSATYSGLRGIEINNTAETSHYQFYNKLVAGDFEFMLDRNKESYGFEELDIALIDSEDASTSLTLKFYSDNTFSIGGSSFRYTLNTEKRTDISLGFENTMLYVNSTPFELDYFDNGEEFDLFPSGYIYLNVTATGSDSSYVITRIGNFPTYKTTDDVLPDHAMEGDFGGSYGAGSIYHIYKMYTADVVRPYSKATLTVTVNGKSVKSTDGLILKDVPSDVAYDIYLSEYGTYSFVYKFEGEKKTYSYAIESVDVTDPTIEFTSICPSAVRQNSTIQMPTFTYSDNYSSKENLRIITSVVIPTGYEEFLTYSIYDEDNFEYVIVNKDKTSIVAHYKGTYTFKIIVIDEAGNSLMKTFDVTVY